MPIYTVTYCTMDQEAGANPMWHTCLLLSRLNEQTQKLEVIDNWGFYGLPSTVPNSILRRVKIKAGLDVDLTGNHGMLRHEELRFLDLGCGLHGATFELTEEKFNELQQKCLKMVADQEAAINDVVKPLGLKGKPPSKSRIYPHEDLSTHIFALEKARAKELGKEPRLKEFNLMFGCARTCKAQAIELLEGILSPAQIKRITGLHRAVSRFSGKMENIYLHSSGPMRQHVKRSGEAIYYRDAADPAVKLHWTLPPQEIETLSGETRDLFKVHSDHCDEVKVIVRRLQRLEWLFINAVIDANYFELRDRLVTLIRNHYEAFAKIEPKQAKNTQSGWTGSFLWLLSLPRDSDEATLMTQIKKANHLFNSLYMAMDEADEKPRTNFESNEAIEEDELIYLVNCLGQDRQQELCNIIGRNYIVPEETSVASRVNGA